MARLLVLASLAAIVAASAMASHIQGYPRGLESLFGTKREVTNEKEKERSVCESDECKLIAKVMKDSMNEDINPCDDFYEYACGQWSNNNPVPENTSTWSLWNMVKKKVEKQVGEIIQEDAKPDDLFVMKLAKMWFKSCMDIEAEEKRGVEPILSTLWRHGGWPLIMQDTEWNSRIYNWQIVDDHYTRLLSFNALHDVRYGYATYESNRSILIETPHLPLGLYTIIRRSPPPITDSSDENNESGEGSQERGSKERGSNKGDENEENDEDEDSGIDEDDSDNDVETKERDEELQKKRVATRKHNRLGHGKKHNKKIAGQTTSARKTRKRTKRDIMEAKILRRMLRNLKKLSKTRSHQAKKTKGTSSKRGHLSADKGKTSVKKNQGAGEQKHSVAHSKKLGHEKTAKDKEVEEQQKKKETKKKNKRLGHGNRKSKKSTVTRRHVHENKANDHTRKHRQSKTSNHKTHYVANKVEDNTDENNNSVGDDKENGDNGDSDDDGEDNNISADEDGNEESDEKDDEDDEEDNEEEDDDEEDDDEEDDEDDDEDEIDVKELTEKYRQYILNVSLILSKGRGIEVPRERLEKDIADLVEFAIKVGQLTLLEEDDPVITTLNDFQRAYTTLESNSPNSKVNWKRKIQKLFDEAGVELDDDVEITITCQNYLRRLKQLLDETPSVTIVNYVHWLFLSKMLMFSSRELKDLTENWLGWTNYDTREEQCIMQVEMSDIVGYQYVKKHFSGEIAATARDMIDDIQKEVEYQIKESTWMDEDTKHFVLDKLVAMKNMVGHPDWYLNDTAVQYYFQGLTIGPSYYENIMSYVRNMKWQRLRDVLQEDERQDSEMVDPLMLNAFFMPTENSITITAVDFQNPFFALNRPWSINYGIIGVIMGHEVNHGFDDQGRLFDRKGNPMEWLSAMADAYNQRAECFVDQFNSYSMFKNENYTVENYGNQTIGENIADTMGLQAVYRAYQRRQRECKKPDPALPGFENFDNDQIFFLSFANLWCDNEDRESVIESAKYDVHSTGRLRVIGSVSNSKDFAKAYNCPVGSPMNPERKCNIWI